MNEYNKYKINGKNKLKKSFTHFKESHFLYLFFLEKHSLSFSQVFTRITDQRLMQIKIKSSPEEPLFILAIVFENDCECDRCFFKTKN